MQPDLEHVHRVKLGAVLSEDTCAMHPGAKHRTPGTFRPAGVRYIPHHITWSDHQHIPVCNSHPDMTCAVDWALKANYLSISNDSPSIAHNLENRDDC